MKKLILLCLLFSIQCSASFLSNGDPSLALSKVFYILGIKTDGTAQSLNKIAQRDFLRKTGQERWEMEKKYEDKRDKLLPVFRELGVIDEVLPKEKHYDHIIIHGCTVDGMRQRIMFLNQLWDQGLRGEHITLLTGERPLTQEEMMDINVLTESEAGKFLWSKAVRNEELRNKKLLIVSVPMIKDQKTGALKRPNTRDTFDLWLLTHRPSGKCLAISRNPYIPYQHQTALKALRDHDYSQNLVIETVGQACYSDTPNSIHLDNIARILYTEMN